MAFGKNDVVAAVEALTKAVVENTVITKMMREDLEKQKSSMQTLTKHVKFLVHTVRLVNPELKDPADD